MKLNQILSECKINECFQNFSKIFLNFHPKYRLIFIKCFLKFNSINRKFLEHNFTDWTITWRNKMWRQNTFRTRKVKKNERTRATFFITSSRKKNHEEKDSQFFLAQCKAGSRRSILLTKNVAFVNVNDHVGNRDKKYWWDIKNWMIDQ